MKSLDHQPTVPPASSRAIGRHLLLDLYEVQDPRLGCVDSMTALFEKLLDECGFHRLGIRSKQFPGENAGLTLMVLLSESHASIHTYPEHAYAAVDVFSCGNADLQLFVSRLIDALQPGSVEQSEHARGSLCELNDD
jgi:S-adenosylmethionine decarboxylase